MASLVALLVPFPMIKSPVLVIGDKALNAALAVVWPVPPLRIGKVPVTPVVRGKPVTLVITPDCGVPRIGVTKVGDVANTSAPEPVSSVTVAAKLALVGVAKKVAMPVAKPVIDPTAGVIVVLVTLVTCPWALVVKTGTWVAEP